MPREETLAPESQRRGWRIIIGRISREERTVIVLYSESPAPMIATAKEGA